METKREQITTEVVFNGDRTYEKDVREIRQY